MTTKNIKDNKATEVKAKIKTNATKATAKKKNTGIIQPTFKWEKVDQGSETVLIDENENSFKDYLKANKGEEAYAKTKLLLKNFNKEVLKSGTEFLNNMENCKEVETLVLKTSDDEFNASLSFDVKWEGNKAYGDNVNVSTTNPYAQELNKYSEAWSIKWED